MALHRWALVAALTLGCLPGRTQSDSQPEGDADSDSDGDSDSDSDADSDTDQAVLVDEEYTLPGPPDSSDYFDVTFDLSPAGGWYYVELQSDDASWMYGILTTPMEACTLELPGWEWAMEEHRNRGWVQLTDEGLYTLSIFGMAPEGDAQVRVLVTRQALDTLPVAENEACIADEATCDCTVDCNCDAISW